ncbi:MAG: hypothetical protein M0R06_02110 [Sphaerochaeta sp.]|jgi:hypothetical protein|nr:hypothetical protein [Sphaerochaeta sp.]
MIQDVPTVARAHAAEQRCESATAISAALRLWRRVGTDFDVGYAAIEPQLLEVMDTAQRRITANAITYVPEVLTVTAPRAATVEPRYAISVDTFVGVDGAGLPTQSLAYQAVVKSRVAVSEGLTAGAALNRGEKLLSLMLGTLFADTARGATGLASFALPVGGYVRMLSQPSCGRCVILAGKWYRTNKGFKRHPGCDCYHIPSTKEAARDIATGPVDYLDSLDEQGRARALGSYANARAYADGADPYQLVNAYRSGISTGQVYNRNITYTTEGTTRRGFAYSKMSNVRALSSMGEEKRGRYRALVAPRLMPESIYQIAPTKERADQMLRDFGWVM